MNSNEKQYAISESLLKEMMNLLGELPLKNSMNLYLQIQKTVTPLDSPDNKVE